MKEIDRLINRITDRVNINLREPSFDVSPFVRDLIPESQFTKFYAFYGLTPYHPLHFHFSNSSLAGSYFLGKCVVEHSVLYKSDIRGDELKPRDGVLSHCGLEVALHEDEVIRIKDSFLVKTLVHSHSHNPECPEEFHIRNTVSMPYSNIHGSPTVGSFLGAFSTVDLTTLHDCVVGEYAYVQVGEIAHHMVAPGQIWIHADGAFDFSYRFPEDVLDRYVSVEPGKLPAGIFMDFVERRKADFQRVFETAGLRQVFFVPPGAYLSRYAVVKGRTSIEENCLVAQRAYIEESKLGRGSNAQENCYIIQSTLEGCNVTAHGGKIIHAKLGKKVFVGFNSFLQGTVRAPLHIGEESIVMPHTIIDLEEPVSIPPNHLVWGYIRNRYDLETHCVSIEEFTRMDRMTKVGAMRFQGAGGEFVKAFRRRIEGILEANGAFYDVEKDTNRGHAQTTHSISFNTIQPYMDGEVMGLYPTMDIRP